MCRDARGRTDPMGTPLFSASHVNQWDALSSAPEFPVPSSSFSGNDHEWHWHPSKWPLLQHTPSSSSDYTTVTRPKTLLLSSELLGRTQPRVHARHARSESVAPAEDDCIGENSSASPPEEQKIGSEERQRKYCRCTEIVELVGNLSNGDDRFYSRAGNIESSCVVACHGGTNGNTAVSILPSDHRDKSHRMAVKTHVWISLWFLLTAPVIFWDVSYCFMRPRSMVGGDLHWIWEPYGLYQEIDYVYGVESLQRNDGFPNAQSLMNIIETLLNLTYLYFTHVSGATVAPLIGFAAATMTLSKTVLYWVQEFYCGWCATGHNDLGTLLVYWVLPNGLWIVFPSLIVYTLGKDIAAALGAAQQRAIKATLGKKN